MCRKADKTISSFILLLRINDLTIYDLSAMYFCTVIEEKEREREYKLELVFISHLQMAELLQEQN